MIQKIEASRKVSLIIPWPRTNAKKHQAQRGSLACGNIIHAINYKSKMGLENMLIMKRIK